MEKLIEIKDLYKHYPILGGILKKPVNHVRALDGISMDIYKGECIGVVGESGCGKTTTGKAIVRLHDPTSGQIIFNHTSKGSSQPVDISTISLKKMKQKGVRSKLQMVFQDPTTSMNPRMLVKNIIAEPIREQVKLSNREMLNKVIELLTMVGLTKDHVLRYPHEFSGGQRQRIAVARAISTNPEFIVLDEPTSALDVSVQAQILNLLVDLQQKLNLTYMFVTHHLLVVKYISHRIAVMYLGKIIEIAKTSDIFLHPVHPYTHALMSGIPIPDIEFKSNRIVLEGDVPSPVNPPKGCRFHTRCPFVIDICKTMEPELKKVGEEHLAACHRASETEKLVHDTFGSKVYF